MASRDRSLSPVRATSSGYRERSPRRPTVAPSAAAAAEKETDVMRLRQRQRQIDIGKNTLAYDAYVAAVPVDQRDYERRWTDHPRTPDVEQKCSKRAFAGQVKKWRRLVYQHWAPAASTTVAGGGEGTTTTTTTTTTKEEEGKSTLNPTAQPFVSADATAIDNMQIDAIRMAQQLLDDDDDDENVVAAADDDDPDADLMCDWSD